MSMTSLGVVKSVDGQMARVLVETGASCCEGCQKEACDINTRGIETEAVNLVNAKVGQKVRVTMETHTYVKGALILFIIPMLALLAGAMAGKVYLPIYFPETGKDMFSVIGGFLSFLVSLVLVGVLSRRMERRKEDKSVIEEIIGY